MRRPSQNTRVLDALKAAGGHGITQRNFSAPNVTDGFGEISRLAARIFDLRQEWSIPESGKTRDGYEVYVLEGRLTPPPMTEPIRDRNRWLVVHSCRRCLGCVARPEQACGPTQKTLWSPTAPAGVLGCRINEARADKARREQRNQEVRHAA